MSEVDSCGRKWFKSEGWWGGTSPGKLKYRESLKHKARRVESHGTQSECLLGRFNFKSQVTPWRNESEQLWRLSSLCSSKNKVLAFQDSKLCWRKWFFFLSNIYINFFLKSGPLCMTQIIALCATSLFVPLRTVSFYCRPNRKETNRLRRGNHFIMLLFPKS